MRSDTVANAIDRQEWLDSVDALQKSVRGLLSRSEAVKDLLHGVWLGHPLHPVLTDIPLGAWTVAMVLDAAGMFGSEASEKGADIAVGIGLAGAVGSAVTGLADWSETDGRAKRIGSVHAALNIAATALYTGSLLLRGRRRNRSRAVALSMLGYAVAGASAYLGGHLVFGEQVGVDHTATADADRPDEWTAATKESDLADDTPLRVVAGGVAVCLVRRQGRIFAISDTCSHLGGPLSEGELGEGTIRCPWHGSEFSFEDGSVVHGPATAPARRYETRTRGGFVELKAVKT